jgi:hypothetical protein
LIELLQQRRRADTSAVARRFGAAAALARWVPWIASGGINPCAAVLLPAFWVTSRLPALLAPARWSSPSGPTRHAGGARHG